jgi:MFS family permease
VRGLPFAATMIVVSPRSADLAARFGVRRVVGTGMTVFTVGLVMLSLVEVGTSYLYVVVCLVIAAAGVASTMPSLSAGIVQSVPMHKAGVGSAVNDTTREVGGAIGIAVVGTVVTSVYRDHLSPALAVLPPELADVARDNVAKALAVADQGRSVVGDEQADQLVAEVRQAFVDGAHVGLRIAAALVMVAALVVVARVGSDDSYGARHH